MIMLDGLGSWSTAEKGANLYSQFKTNSSTEYQILQQNAESGKAIVSNYTLELQTWKEEKREAKRRCNSRNRSQGSRGICLDKWLDKNAMPKQTANGQIKIDDYKSIKEDNQSFLDEYLFTILFVLLSLMTLLMQYLTIAKIYDDYNDIEEGLTFERIEFINDTIQEHETILAEHEQKVAELMADSTREKKGKDRKFQEIGEAIAITHKQKMNDTRAETVKRIANNVYVPQEESKAGFAHNPFFKEEMNQHEKNVRGLNDEDEILKRFDSVIDKEEKYQSIRPNNPTNQSDQSTKNNDNSKCSDQSIRLNNQTNQSERVQSIDFRLFNQDEVKLLSFLWAKGTIKQSDQLITKKAVLKVIGNNRGNSDALTKLYKKLHSLGYISKHGVHYVAEAEFPTQE